MKNKLLTIVIPISGELADLQNLRQSLKYANEFEPEVDVILLFDEKNTGRSKENWLEISTWDQENIQIYRESFSSVGSARNLGISKATSSWISFTDADDINLVENFLLMVREAEIDNSDVAIGEFNSINVRSGEGLNDNNASLNLTTFQTVFGLKPGIWRCAFKLESVRDVRFPDLNMAEDQVFISRYFDLERRIHFCAQIVYHYFVGRENSLTSKMDEVMKISRAIPISTRLAIETKGPNLRLLETLAISQLLSAIKYGSTNKRIRSLFEIFRFLSQGPNIRVFQRLRIILQIAKR
jgi:glycosyltransferase involved in cell wall biosynthesis